ncbi:MAG: RNA-guided endonuclease IscB [Candidatus Heimdallarchaeota archaeon]
MEKHQENTKSLTQRVFVQNHHGNPLMPTTPRNARRLLNSGKAKIVRYNPFFTIQLQYGSSGYRQPIERGFDAGYGIIGFSTVTETEELVSGELNLLEGMSDRLTDRRNYRRQRRQRKRYRPPRWNNRRRVEGWLAPSIQHKLDAHFRLLELLKEILPIKSTTIEVANFDIQKIKQPDIVGVAYQQGEQLGFWNIREYVLHRDHHTCQNSDCKNRATQKILQVHHIGYWQGDLSNRPDNLITLCIKCHTPKNHQENRFLYGWQPKVNGFKAETFMSIVRWRLVHAVSCAHTYGYLTKQHRKALALPKTHYHDAFVIAGGTTQKRAVPLELEQIRRNNRSLQKFYDAKYIDRRTGHKANGQELCSGRRTRNITLNDENFRDYRGCKVSKGRVSIRRQRYRYQPKDYVRYKGQQHLVKGMQNYGQYVKLDSLPRPVKTILVQPVRWRKGICSMG